MTHQFPPDIEALIQQQLATGNYESPDQLFRVALEQLASQDEEIAAIQRSIDLLDEGDNGVLLDDAMASLRVKHNIPADA